MSASLLGHLKIVELLLAHPGIVVGLIDKVSICNV